MKRRQHEETAKQNECVTKKVHSRNMTSERNSETLKECNTEKVQHRKSAT